VERKKERKKFQFRFSRMGNRMKNSKEGRTNQKISIESSAIFPVSFVSKYIQSIARKEINGIEAKIAPIKLLLLETSLIRTIKPADIITFNK
jgi:hypothetical protein